MCCFLKTSIPKTIKASRKVDENAKQIITDPGLLRRVISNIVINAVQAMPQGEENSLFMHTDSKAISS